MDTNAQSKLTVKELTEWAKRCPIPTGCLYVFLIAEQEIENRKRKDQKMAMGRFIEWLRTFTQDVMIEIVNQKPLYLTELGHMRLIATRMGAMSMELSRLFASLHNSALKDGFGSTQYKIIEPEGKKNTYSVTIFADDPKDDLSFTFKRLT